MPGEQKYLKFVSMVTEIFDTVTEIETQTEGLSYKEFMKKPLLHEMLLSHVSRIQEMTRGLPQDLEANYPGVDWENLNSVGDAVLHPAFGLNPETLWDIVRMDLPFQKKKLLPIVEGCSHRKSGGVCDCC